MSAATTPLETTIEASLAEPTLCHAFLQMAGANGDRVALKEFGSDRMLTFAGWREQARRVAGGLAQLGIGHGDRVGLLLGTRLEFHVLDMAALLLGAVPYSMYATSPVEQLAPCVDNSAPRSPRRRSSPDAKPPAKRDRAPPAERRRSRQDAR